MKQKKKAAQKKKTASKKTTKKAAPEGPIGPTSGAALGAFIEARFKEVGGFRGETLSRMRALIHEADPEVVEERKWIKPSNPFGVPTYSHAGLLCTLEVYKDYVKLTFAQGSKLADPKRLFNASLLGLRRAIDIREGQRVDADAFKALVRAAVALNLAK